jgi:chaperonin cofactor prefoldin
MARSITVKVATPKVIKALEAKLETIKANYANQEKLEAGFQTELKAWNTSLTEYAFSKIDSATNIRTNYRQWSNSLNIDFDVTTDKDFPEQPTRNFTTMAKYEYDNAVEEITNALNILRMTDEETVNASTMKSIAQYL